MSGTTDGWQIFDDPRFELRFRYPDPTPLGTIVQRTERLHGSGFGVHVHTEDTELYVELMRFLPTAPADEYAAHRDSLEKRFGEDSVSKLGSTFLAGQPARSYSFRWPGAERAAIVLATGTATYRVIYNPASPLNSQVIETFDIREPR